MAVEDIQQLIDLLALSPEVTELSVQSASGNKLTVKRQPVALVSTEVIVQEQAFELDDDDEQVFETSIGNSSLSITATMVGLFHETNPPITGGSSITTGQIVGYIESMRLMNEVVSTVEGTITSAIASEGQPVEYGQPLFVVTVL